MHLLFGDGQPPMHSPGKVLPSQAVHSIKKCLKGVSVPLKPPPGSFNDNVSDLCMDIDSVDIVIGFHDAHHPTLGDHATTHLAEFWSQLSPLADAHLSVAVVATQAPLSSHHAPGGKSVSDRISPRALQSASKSGDIGSDRDERADGTSYRCSICTICIHHKDGIVQKKDNLNVNKYCTGHITSPSHPAALSFSCLAKVDTGAISDASSQPAGGIAGQVSKCLQFTHSMLVSYTANTRLQFLPMGKQASKALCKHGDRPSIVLQSAGHMQHWCSCFSSLQGRMRPISTHWHG